MIGLIAAAAIAAIVVVLTVGRRDTTPAHTSAPRVTTDASPTASSAVALADARALVVRYLDDVNTQNRSDAQSLICTSLADSWRSTIDQPNGDFTVRVTKATFTNYHPTTDGIQLDYTLDVTPATAATAGSTSDTAESAVTFTVVHDLTGLRICGEN